MIYASAVSRRDACRELRQESTDPCVTNSGAVGVLNFV